MADHSWGRAGATLGPVILPSQAQHPRVRPILTGQGRIPAPSRSQPPRLRYAVAEYEQQMAQRSIRGTGEGEVNGISTDPPF